MKCQTRIYPPLDSRKRKTPRNYLGYRFMLGDGNGSEGGMKPGVLLEGFMVPRCIYICVIGGEYEGGEGRLILIVC